MQFNCVFIILKAQKECNDSETAQNRLKNKYTLSIIFIYYNIRTLIYFQANCTEL